VTADRIEKTVLLPAPLQQVWSAISDANQFGHWFGVAFDGPFAAGSKATGKIAPTAVDAEVAKLQAPHVGKRFEIWVERVEPLSVFSFRWHPYAIDPTVDYSTEPMTLIQFELTSAATGTRLVISESGFDQIPESRRAEAYAADDGGWGMQAILIGKYLTP
jgi:uncharacterized protein YndB with AHSA1/START domain